MNGVLPALTWGTWDEEDWRVEAAATVAARSSATPLANANNITATSASSSSDKSQRKLLKKGLRAPNESQLWFDEVLARVDSSEFGQQRCKYRCNPLRCMHNEESELLASSGSVIPWDELPDGIHPRDGKLPPLRARNKRHQVENLAVFLQRMLRPGDVVVEFCAGSGYVALPLACMFPQCTFVLLDMKKPSLDIGTRLWFVCALLITRQSLHLAYNVEVIDDCCANLCAAEERIAAAGLTNVEIFCGFIDDYDKPFDVGIALHACGEATDMVMQKCLDERAAYVLAPCCVGKIKLSALEYPRSQALGQELSRTEYQVLAKAADFGHMNNAMSHSEINMRRRRCKSILESDRNMRAREAQYQTRIFVMYPHDVTPKNDILVGIPQRTEGDEKKRQLTLSCDQKLSEPDTTRVIFGL